MLFVAGQQPTYADVVLFEMLAYAHDEAGDRAVVNQKQTPWLWAHYQAMLTVPALEEYMASRRRIPSPGHSDFVHQVSDILGLH